MIMIHLLVTISVATRVHPLSNTGDRILVPLQAYQLKTVRAD